MVDKITWRQFNKERMGPYMKRLGSHGVAIKQIAKEWKEHKEKVAKQSPVVSEGLKTELRARAEVAKVQKRDMAAKNKLAKQMRISKKKPTRITAKTPRL